MPTVLYARSFPDPPSRGGFSSSDMFRLLVQSVKDCAIFMLDPGGHVVTWNEGARWLKGYTDEEIVGQHFSIFYPEAVRASGWPGHELEMAARYGRFEDEGWRVRKDGSEFWAEVSITAVRNDADQLIGFGKVTRDLTERKRAEDALRQGEERYRMLVEAVREYAIFMLDPLGYVVTWNEGAERLKGYTFDEIVGRHFSIFYPPEAVEMNWPQRELAIARAQGRFEDIGWRVRKDGSRFWANVVVTALFDSQGVLRGYSKVTRDITERKQFEDSTRALNRELQQRVDELASANRALSEKSMEIETFVHGVSHDIRGPLVNLQGFNEELRLSCRDILRLIESHPEAPDDLRGKVRDIVMTDIEESTGYMQKAVKHLSGIVDALLRLSRIGRIVYQRETVNMGALATRVLSAMRRTIAQAGIDVTLGDLPDAVGDETAFEQVFSNLIGNAIRYRDPARPCHIEISGKRDEERKIAVYCVKDNGLGIPAVSLPQVFTAFRRFHPEAGPGEGMGLVTVRRILERQNGRIRVESVQGEGSSFTFELPDGSISEA